MENYRQYMAILELDLAPNAEEIGPVDMLGQPIIPLMRYKLHWLDKGIIGSGRAA